jgi:hypothetical protein
MPVLTDTYNGWANRETWTVNLWITNDRYYYDELCHILKKFETAHAQAEVLEKWVTNEHDFWGEDATIWSDLVHSALSRVDWREIVENN